MNAVTSNREMMMTLGQAARIEGMTPGAITAVLGYLRRSARAKQKAQRAAEA
jgi:tRNA U34 5-carboxymethylaminomethyl modifying enzyme MnmG/GidA